MQKTGHKNHLGGIINSVLGKLKTPGKVDNEALRHDLTELKKVIEGLRSHVDSAGLSDISRSYIPESRDELHAAINTAEEAAFTISDLCEKILEDAKAASPNIAQQVKSNVVKILEACAFQDLTGQRIKKVSENLKYIDGRILSILAALEGETVNHQHEVPRHKKDSLLNGPGVPQNAMTQADIDKMLSKLDRGTNES